MRDNLFFLFALVQAVGALFAVLYFFGIDWRTLKDKITKKGQTSMFETKPRKMPVLMLLLVFGSIAFSAYGWYRSTDSRNCQTYLATWGTAPPNKMGVVVDTNKLLDKQKSYHLLLVGRPADHTLDAKRDTGIIKSSIFGIAGGLLPMEAVISQEQLQRMANNGGWLEFYLVILPKDIEVDQIKVLEDAENHGGQVLESHSFLVGFFTTPINPAAPNQGAPPLKLPSGGV